jgi:hypothetical protein
MGMAGIKTTRPRQRQSPGSEGNDGIFATFVKPPESEAVVVLPNQGHARKIRRLFTRNT